MSEYQYYEWQVVDRVLTPEEQAAVNKLSSHIEVGPGGAVVTYNWSSFRHDPKQVLLKYFDAFFYLANWGSLQLMFRFPVGLLDASAIEPYCVDEYITFETIGDYQVLDLDLSPDEWGGWMEPKADLSHFVRLRADLLEGDYRLLYLAWLKAMTLYADDEWDRDDVEIVATDREPPVPPGLKELSPSLQDFCQSFEIDPFLIQAAAQASADPKATLPIDYRTLIARLPREECDDFLARLANGDSGAGLALRKRLDAYLPPERTPAVGRRTFQQLMRRAGQIEQAEKKRRAEAARQKHITEMQALAAREAQVWGEVETLLDTGRKMASVYDEATAMLASLEQLAAFQDTQAAFQARLHQLARKYALRRSLIDRWRQRGWIG